MKISDFLKNVVVLDTQTEEVLMNTAELEPEVFEMLMEQLKDGVEVSFDMDVDPMEASEIFDDEGISERLAMWGYFLSEGYEPDPDGGSLYGFPEVYVDEKEYTIKIEGEGGFIYTCVTDIDTL